MNSASTTDRARAAVWSAPGKLEMTDVDIPIAPPGGLLLEVSRMVSAGQICTSWTQRPPVQPCRVMKLSAGSASSVWRRLGLTLPACRCHSATESLCSLGCRVGAAGSASALDRPRQFAVRRSSTESRRSSPEWPRRNKHLRVRARLPGGSDRTSRPAKGPTCGEFPTRSPPRAPVSSTPSQSPCALWRWPAHR